MLIAASAEFYLTGMVTATVKNIRGGLEDQNLLQDILEDFLQLYTNTNLLIIVCHRIEALNKLADTENLVDRATLNQLNKLYDKVKAKLPFSIIPMNPLKRIKVNTGLKVLRATVSNTNPDELNVGNIHLDEVREMLNRIRTK